MRVGIELAVLGQESMKIYKLPLCIKGKPCVWFFFFVPSGIKLLRLRERLWVLHDVPQVGKDGGVLGDEVTPQPGVPGCDVGDGEREDVCAPL